MKVAICTVGRLENRYINEFVDHYRNIGIDKIFIHDNNYDGEDHFEDVLQQDINSGLVEIINYRNRQVCQLEAYMKCYELHKNEYDWILFIDCDEFLYMEHFNNIHEFLAQPKFNSFQMIHINWMIYGDNDLVYYENKKLKDRFINPILPFNFKTTENDMTFNCHIKSIIRGGLERLIFVYSPHTPENNFKCCDATGNVCQSNSPFLVPYNFTEAHFKHYVTKTIDEYYHIKVKRGFPDVNKDFFKTNNWIEQFFKINKMTIEKQLYIRGLYNKKIVKNEKLNGI